MLLCLAPDHRDSSNHLHPTLYDHYYGPSDDGMLNDPTNHCPHSLHEVEAVDATICSSSSSRSSSSHTSSSSNNGCSGTPDGTVHTLLRQGNAALTNPIQDDALPRAEQNAWDTAVVATMVHTTPKDTANTSASLPMAQQRISTSSITVSSHPLVPTTIHPTMKPKKSVQWSTMDWYSHEIILGDNPSVSTGGPPITIRWKAHEHVQMTIDEYEQQWEVVGAPVQTEEPTKSMTTTTTTTRRSRSKAEMLIPRQLREEWLRNGGYSRKEIAAASAEVERIRRLREQSARDGPRSPQRQGRPRIYYERLQQQFCKMLMIQPSSSSSPLPPQPGMNQYHLKASLTDKNPMIKEEKKKATTTTTKSKRTKSHQTTRTITARNACTAVVNMGVAAP